MTQQIINIGSYNDDGTGDTLRVGAQKINENFTELYAKTSTIINGVIAGDGINVTYAGGTGKVTISNTRISESSFGVVTATGAGNDPLQASEATSTLNFAAGTNIKLSTSTTNNTLTIDAIWPDEFYGDTYGTHRGNSIGDVLGKVTGDVVGSIFSSNGLFKVLDHGTNGTNAVYRGSVIGNVSGNVTGNLIGNVTGNVTGNASTVTNGVYRSDLGTVTNAMLAGSISNDKILNAFININGQQVNLGGSTTIPQYILPIASNSALGGVKVGTGLAINSQSGVLTTSQDISTTASPVFNTITSTGSVILMNRPSVSSHAVNKEYVDEQFNDLLLPNSKIENPFVIINGQQVSLGSSLNISQYSLPIASNSALGGIRIGSGLTVTNQGIVNTVQDIRTTASPTFIDLTITGVVALDKLPTLSQHATNKQYVDNRFNTLTVPNSKIENPFVIINSQQVNLGGSITIPQYVLPTANDTTLGGVKVGTGLVINAQTGVLTTAQDIRTTASPSFSNVTVTGSVTVPIAPTVGNHVTNKTYVDAQVASIPQYSLPTASPTILGGVKVGASLTIDAQTSVLTTVQDIRTTASPTFNNITSSGSVIIANAPVENSHAANKLYVDTQVTNVPTYTLPTASPTILGGVKVGASLTIDAQTGILTTAQDIRTTASPSFANATVTGVITINTGPTQSNHAANKSYVDSRIASIPAYILPAATNSILGGVKVGASLTIDSQTSVLTTVQDIRTTASPSFVNITATGNVNISSAPTIDTHAANKLYVDTKVSTIPGFSLPTASSSVLGGIKVGESLSINSQTGILTTIQDIRTTASPSFSNVTVTGSVTVSTAPTSGSHAANKSYVDSVGFPIGGIIMWSGLITNIPTRWALCNGQNGTPDLRDRFIIGAGSTYSVNATGGSLNASLTASSSGAHMHTSQTGSTALLVDQIPSHTHTIIDTSAPSPNSDTIGSFDTDTYTNQTGGSYVTTTATGGGQGHVHSISSDGAHTHSITGTVTPPYYALAFIMKVS